MNKGFSALIFLLLIPVILGILFFALKDYSPLGEDSFAVDIYNWAKEDLGATQKKVSSNVSWEFGQDTKTWQAIGTPPVCPEPFVFPSPVDINLATSILYPGQERGGDYKAHGGFRFDNLPNNEVNVYAPFDASVVAAARHTQGSDIQYVLYFTNNCGMAYKLDHLRELTSKFQKIMEDIPLGGDTDTRSTGVTPPVFVAKGELIATKVGMESTKNVFFDFGVYDFRQRNSADYSGRNYYNIEQYGMHAICWLENLEESTKTVALSLPGADGQNGKKSDYCREAIN